jgi:hypothetical protein
MAKQKIVVTIEVETTEMPDPAAFVEAARYSIEVAVGDLYGVEAITVASITTEEAVRP